MTPTFKPVWTDADLDVMSFHDVHVRAFCAEPESYEMLMDLDYLFRWVAPGEGETCFRFWVAPVTLVFENVHGVRLDLQSSQGDIEIAKLDLEEGTLTHGARTDSTWTTARPPLLPPITVGRGAAPRQPACSRMASTESTTASVTTSCPS